MIPTATYLPTFLMGNAMETVLASLAGSSSTERVLVVLCQDAGEPSRLEMRQQSWGVGVGWFTQSSVKLEPSQVSQLRQSLGMTAGVAATRPKPLPKSFSQVDSVVAFPRVVRADSA
jgi:hypothetical protein